MSGWQDISSTKDRSIASALQKLLRTLLWAIPGGILFNLVLTVYLSEQAPYEKLMQFPVVMLWCLSALSCLPWFMHALRIKNWSHFFSRPLALAECLRISAATHLGSAATPAIVGGSYLKLALLLENGFSAGLSSSIILLATLEDALVLLPILIVALISPGVRDIIPLPQPTALLARPGVWMVIIGMIAAVLIYIASNRSENPASHWFRIRQKAAAIRREWSDVSALISRFGKGRLLVNVLLNAVQWLARYLVLYFILIGLGISVPLDRLCVLQWSAFTAMLLVPTPGAAIGAEAAFMLLFKNHIPSSLLALTAAGWRWFTFYLPLALAVITFLVLHSRRPRAQLQARPSLNLKSGSS
jgi:uncharacterized protein (TIRG00374 family)